MALKETAKSDKNGPEIRKKGNSKNGMNIKLSKKKFVLEKNLIINPLFN